ncbi:MAG: purine-nucleoside phosphorylase, partial [Terracidiphilus sp.]
MTYYEQVAEAAEALRWRIGNITPRFGIVLGSGLAAAADAVANPVTVPFSEIPHFPKATVEGHPGRVVAG